MELTGIVIARGLACADFGSKIEPSTGATFWLGSSGNLPEKARQKGAPLDEVFLGFRGFLWLVSGPNFKVWSQGFLDCLGSFGRFRSFLKRSFYRPTIGKKVVLALRPGGKISWRSLPIFGFYYAQWARDPWDPRSRGLWENGSRLMGSFWGPKDFTARSKILKILGAVFLHHIPTFKFETPFFCHGCKALF